MTSPQDILKEVVALNKRRTTAGISPLEYQRWLDLSARLRKEFPGHPPLGGRAETRIRAEFRDLEALRSATMPNIRPIGIWLNTPFAADVGTTFVLVAVLKESGEELCGRVEVVSNDIGPDYSTAELGMGMKFREHDCALRTTLERLRDGAG